ncbi:Arv1-domain-containing protein [Peniophora sp. CONT]|nr:Arv1-domain-containing protein [Peniophora sp. CONT]
MPLCVSCAQPVPHLYTVYQSANNVRLEQCPACHSFADPYVEHDNLIVLLDLILLKRGVYRHLLFNRGSPPRYAATKPGPDDTAGNATTADHTTDNARWMLTLRVGLAVVFIDSFIRWSELRPRSDSQEPWTTEDAHLFARVLLGCLVETLTFHAGITASSFIVLSFHDWFASRKTEKDKPSPVRQALRYSHIPLCLLYSSATKFFLLFLLAVWDTSTTQASSVSPPHEYAHTLRFENTIFLSIWNALDDNTLDRRWVVRNVLGGMSAGFGLRVVLDCHPAFTTLIILAGWAVKTGVASFVSGFVGQDRIVGEAWLEYSIP